MFLHTNNLTAVFSEEPIFKPISIHILSPGLYAVLGKSGSGKTTFMRIISGLEKRYVGSFEAEGVFAFAFQEHRLFGNLTATQNIANILKNVTEEQTKKALYSYGFSKEEVDYFPHQLSGGMKQRVNILRALLSDADILFFDEPTKELDEKLREKVMNDLIEISKTSIVFFTVHDEEVARKYGAKIIQIEK